MSVLRTALGGGAGRNPEGGRGRKTELLSPFQSYVWKRGGDYTSPSSRCMPVSHTDASPSHSLGNFPQIRKRTGRQTGHKRRVFTITAQRKAERASTQQLRSLEQVSTSAPRRAATHGEPDPRDSAQDLGHLEEGQTCVFYSRCKWL